MSQSPSVSRELYLPREVVFEAWIEPEHLAVWYPPGASDGGAAVVEPVPGGRFEVTWRDGDGATAGEHGRLEALETPERLVLALGGEADEAASLRLEVRFVDGVDVCRIEIRQAGSTAPAETFSALWEARLDRLEGYFSVV